MGKLLQLERDISQFVAGISNKGVLTSEDIQELENHLYDSSMELIKSGLTETEAFVVARMRIGKQHVIAKEFEKVNGNSLLNREWIFIFWGAALAVIIYNIKDVLELWLGYKTASGAFSTTISAVLLSSFYIMLILLSILIFKKGDSLIQYCRENLFDKNRFWLAFVSAIIGMLCLVPLNKLLWIDKEFYTPAFTAVNQIIYDNRFTELIIRGTLPVIFIACLFLSSQSIKRKPGWITLFKSNNYLYILFAGLGLETTAAMLGRMFLLPYYSGPLIFAVIIMTGITAFAYYNKGDKHLWRKTACLIAVPLAIEIYASFFTRKNYQGYNPNLLPYFIATSIGITAGIIISKYFVIKTSRPIVSDNQH